MVKYSTEWYKKQYSERLLKAHEYLGGECVKCNSKENLHIHHKSPSNKLFTVTEKLHGTAWIKIEAELDKCQLLCESCHVDHHSAKCGTIGGYKKCKCDLCRNANREYMRKYRKNQNKEKGM